MAKKSVAKKRSASADTITSAILKSSFQELDNILAELTPSHSFTEFEKPLLGSSQKKRGYTKTNSFNESIFAPVSQSGAQSPGDKNRKFRPKASTIAILLSAMLLIAGFWGPQIARLLGIPIDPAPFEAVYCLLYTSDAADE